MTSPTAESVSGADEPQEVHDEAAGSAEEGERSTVKNGVTGICLGGFQQTER